MNILYMQILIKVELFKQSFKNERFEQLNSTRA